MCQKHLERVRVMIYSFFFFFYPIPLVLTYEIAAHVVVKGTNPRASLPRGDS